MHGKDVDTEIDQLLDAIGSVEAKTIRGTAAIVNARLAFQSYDEVLTSDRWHTLAQAGAQPQRPLWASGVKDPAYADTRYLLDLVTSGVVNTMPEATLHAVADHGVLRGDTVRPGYDAAAAVMTALANLGIDYDDAMGQARARRPDHLPGVLGRARRNPRAQARRREARRRRGRPHMSDPRTFAIGLAESSGAREQLSSLRALVVVGMMMFRGAGLEEILRLATSSVPSLSSARAEAVHLVENDELQFSLIGTPRPPSPELTALGAREGAVPVPGAEWGWALPLSGLGRFRGYLVLGADAEPGEEELFLLRVLAEQAGAALTTAMLVEEQREQADELRRMGDRLAGVNARLNETVEDLGRRAAVHEMLNRVPATGDRAEGIVRAVHDLTGLPVVAEDRFGNVLAWAGPGRPKATRKVPARQRADVLGRAQRDGCPVRDRDRLTALAQPRDEVLGVLSLVDPGRTAGPHEVLALEQGATMLAMELAHRHGLAEVELRLRRDLVEDLITGTDEDGAVTRARTLGVDLHRPHRVIVARGRGGVSDEAVAQAVGQAARGLDAGSLLTRRSGSVILLANRPAGWGEDPRWAEIHAAVSRHLRSTAVAMGVGGECERPADYPRSWQQAERAVATRERSRNPGGITAYEDLGLYRVLSDSDGDAEVDRFVREWLGALLDYDTQHHSEMVRTLSTYLDCGGNYDETAAGMSIHRSTLRYRLQRIREVSGFDLGDADHRLNLHVATRAWNLIAAPH